MNIYFPLIFIETLGSGTNKPILTRAIDRFGNREDIVIKLMDSERMNKHAALREFISSKIALTLGLRTPFPCFAEITSEFYESQIGNSEYSRIKNSIGLNFATKNLAGLELFGPLESLSKNLFDEALRIFFFDLMIQNPDRTIKNGKPNLFTLGANLWILDHEIAFSFLFPIIGRPKTKAWEFSDFDKNMIQSHVLFKKLKGQSLNFNILDNFLDRLNEDFWVNLGKIVPKEWMSNDFEKIVDHIKSIKENQNLFINQIKILLS